MLLNHQKIRTTVLAEEHFIYFINFLDQSKHNFLSLGIHFKRLVHADHHEATCLFNYNHSYSNYIGKRYKKVDITLTKWPWLMNDDWYNLDEVWAFKIFRASIKDDSHIKCFETDTIPVSVDKIFEDYCEDLRGNQYQENSMLASCCECIM